MSEFFSYRSERIGGTGPNSGLAYEVVRWFPTSAPGASFSEDLLTTDDRPKIIKGILYGVQYNDAANDKSTRLIMKKKGVSPSILDPGVDLFRKFVLAADPSPQTNVTRMYAGIGNMTLIGSTTAAFWVPLSVFMDVTQDINCQASRMSPNYMDIHFLTGNPDRLMEAALNTPSIG